MFVAVMFLFVAVMFLLPGSGLVFAVVFLLPGGCLLLTVLLPVMMVLPLQGLQARNLHESQGFEGVRCRPPELVRPCVEASAHDDEEPGTRNLPQIARHRLESMRARARWDQRVHFDALAAHLTNDIGYGNHAGHHAHGLPACQCRDGTHPTACDDRDQKAPKSLHFRFSCSARSKVRALYGISRS